MATCRVERVSGISSFAICASERLVWYGIGTRVIGYRNWYVEVEEAGS